MAGERQWKVRWNLCAGAKRMFRAIGSSLSQRCRDGTWSWMEEKILCLGFHMLHGQQRPQQLADSCAGTYVLSSTAALRVGLRWMGAPVSVSVCIAIVSLPWTLGYCSDA